MEKILITWLTHYVGIPVTANTQFINLNFDIFDEAATVDFIRQQFGINVNTQEQWFVDVKELIDAITHRTTTHV
jgi:hypothetical protein